MSSLFKHPVLINSDESNSTEHDATVSLSGTDEFNDTHSVFSDTGSKASKLNDPRKAMHRLNKLKEENAILKESLEKANATDITMLKSKLRGSHADLVRMRQNNSELKDRIQILEGRLFTALSMSSTHAKSSNVVNENVEKESGSDAAIDGLPLHLMEPPLKEKFTSGDRAHLMDMIRSLQSRCKHLARLVQSYETKISVLQSEADARQLKQAPNVPLPAHNTHSIEFELNPPHEVHDVHVDRTNTATVEWTSNPLKSALKGGTTSTTNHTTNPTSDTTNTDTSIPSSNTTSNTTSNTISTKRVKITSTEVESRLQLAREEDQKMIKELSNEVRRLVALLPRDKIDPESEKQESEEESSGEGSGSSGEEGGVNVSGSKAGTVSESAGGNKLPAAAATASSDSRATSAAGTTNKDQYTHGDVLCSFFLGVIIMLICVALSTYVANQVIIENEPKQVL